MTRSERMYREMLLVGRSADAAAVARRVRARRVRRVLLAVGLAALAAGMGALVAWRVRDPGWQASAARQLGLALAWTGD